MKLRHRRHSGRPRLLWTAARTTKCYGSIRPALPCNYRTTLLLSQLLCGTVTKTMSVAPPLGNNWSERNPTLKPSFTSLLLISSWLTCGSSTISLLLISPGPAEASNFFVESSSPPSSWPRLDSVDQPVQWYTWLLSSPRCCQETGHWRSSSGRSIFLTDWSTDRVTVWPTVTTSVTDLTNPNRGHTHWDRTVDPTA